MENAIIIVVLVAIVGGAVAYIVKAKKSGVKCIGCSAGGSCGAKKGGSCGGCNGGEGCGCGCGGESEQSECGCCSGHEKDSCESHRSTK